MYRERNRIERMIGQLKINRAIATRYDKPARSFQGCLTGPWQAWSAPHAHAAKGLASLGGRLTTVSLPVRSRAQTASKRSLRGF